VLALVRLAVFFGAEAPLVPLPPTTGPVLTPNGDSQGLLGATALPTSTPAPRPSAAAARATRAATAPSPALFIPTPSSAERLPTIAYGSLSAEAQKVILLIGRGGPFPYRQDGAVFQNREGLLPAKPSGYYREYTVETPGSSDRGARRLVAGQEGELYFTDDHYASFRRVIP